MATITLLHSCSNPSSSLRPQNSTHLKQRANIRTRKTSNHPNSIRPIRETKQRFSRIAVYKLEPELEPDEEVYSVGVNAALSMLKFYKKEISPLLPKSCRYVPTCSEYSMIAYKKYGAVKGTVLTAWRICRCNPLGGSGFDPPRWFDEETPPPE